MADSSSIPRRDFLKASAAATVGLAGGVALAGVQTRPALRIGLIGCGGRGSWIADLFAQHANARIAAVHDYFKDRATAVGDKHQVDSSRRYWGLDGYRKLLETDIDAVAIETPPYFHPEQAVAALEAGKHVYLAKPVAVDVPGTMAIVKAAERFKDKLCMWVDFQTRMNEFYQGAAKEVHGGLIGDPVTGHVYYIAGRLGAQAKPGGELARLRNWVFDKALSGDIIVEQNIHVIDVANWFLRGHPVKAIGTGGRKARVDVGDCWDHFMVTYTYPNDVLIDFSSAQFTKRFNDLCCRIYGTLGTVDSHYGGNVNILAQTGGYRGGLTSQIYLEGAVANIKHFCAAVESDTPINNAQQSADSTLAAILGRMAAYERKEITWDQMMQRNEKLEARLNLPADGPDWKG